MTLPPWISSLRSSREERAKEYAPGSFTDANFGLEEVISFAHLAGSSQEPKLIAALEKALEALERLKSVTDPYFTVGTFGGATYATIEFPAAKAIREIKEMGLDE